MKNKKGFTLAELLGVLTVLGIIGIIVFPAVDKALKQGKEDLYNIQISNIKTGAMAWVSENPFIAPENEGDVITLTLGQLKQTGKVDDDIKNPEDKTLFPNDMLITITKTKGTYKVEVLTETGTQTGETNYDVSLPVIVLNGNMVEYIELKKSGINYSDPGAIAIYENIDITARIQTTITKNNENVSSISPTNAGTYNITYSLDYNGKKAKAVRTVIVRDSEAPIITVPATTTVKLSDVSKYNLISTINVEDVSEYTVTTDKTLPSVIGTYTITYTATDTAGNIATARRKIIVE